MIHEQLLEHLVAKAIAVGMASGTYPFPYSLEYVIRPEINRIIRSIWQIMSTKEIAATLINLWKSYLEFLGKDSPLSDLKRNQATYYVGRMNTEDSLQKLIEADKLEQNITVKLSIAFGLIKNGDLKKENKLLAELKENEKLDAANRGYHLVYYLDWVIGGEKPPYYDPGNIPWRNTIHALLRHIESKEIKHVSLRRIELYTIKRFIETRSSRGPVTKEIMQRLESAVQSRDNLPITVDKNYYALVEKEFESLKDSWQNVPE